MNQKPWIKVRGLVKRYGERTVVNGVTAEVQPAKSSDLGPNGAGKTTTFYMVVGLVKPDGGTVLLPNGQHNIDLTSAPMYARARNGIGYLAQENSIFRKLSVGDNIRLIWEQNGVPHDERERRCPRCSKSLACGPSSTRVAIVSPAASAVGSRSPARSQRA